MRPDWRDWRSTAEGLHEALEMQRRELADALHFPSDVPWLELLAKVERAIKTAGEAQSVIFALRNELAPLKKAEERRKVRRAKRKAEGKAPARESELLEAVRALHPHGHLCSSTELLEWLQGRARAA